MKSYGRYGALGIELLLSMAVGYYGGRWVDGKLGTRWFQLVGFLIGLYAGFRALFKAAKQMERDVANDEAMERGEDPWDHSNRNQPPAASSASETKDDGKPPAGA